MYIFHCQSRARIADSYDVASTCTMWKYQRHERVAKLGHILCTESTASVYWDASQEELPCTVAYQTKLVGRKGTGLNNWLVARALAAKIYLYRCAVCDSKCADGEPCTPCNSRGALRCDARSKCRATKAPRVIW